MSYCVPFHPNDQLNYFWMLNAMGNVKKLHDVPLIGMTQVLGHHDAPHYITVWLISAFKKFRITFALHFIA